MKKNLDFIIAICILIGSLQLTPLRAADTVFTKSYYLPLIENAPKLQHLYSVVRDSSGTHYTHLSLGMAKNISDYPLTDTQVFQQCLADDGVTWTTVAQYINRDSPGFILFPGQYVIWGDTYPFDYYSQNICGGPLRVKVNEQDVRFEYSYKIVTNTHGIYAMDVTINSITIDPDINEGNVKIILNFTIKNVTDRTLYHVRYFIQGIAGDGFGQAPTLDNPMQPGEIITITFQTPQDMYASPDNPLYDRAIHGTYVIAQGSSDPDIWPY